MSVPERRGRDELERGQRQRLRGLIEAVLPDNPFWATRFSQAGLDTVAAALERIEAADGVGGLPLTTKADLVADHAANPPYGSNLTFPTGEYSRLHQTSGTTGQPLRWLDTPASWQAILDAWEQVYRIAGVEAGDRICFPFSFGPFIGFWAAFEGAARLGHLCLAGGGMTSLGRLRLIEENSATVVCCTPTYALRLAEVAAAESIDLAAGSVRMLIVAGEPGGSIESIRRRIESAWGARVIDHWGMTELGPMAVECSEQPGGMHVLETECIAEIIEPGSGEPVPAGATGELVITTLGRTGSPLFRFRTGALVTAATGDCRGGLSLLRLEGGILGRLDDMLTIRGNNVYPASLEAILRAIDDVVEYRIEVRTEREMDHVRIEVEPAAGADADRLANEVGRQVKDRLNFQVDVVAVEPGALPRFELKGGRLVRRGGEDGTNDG